MAALLRPLANAMRIRMLRYLIQPHHLEEVASHFHLSRQGARKHLDKLVAIGVLERREDRGSRHVTEYMLRPQALFLIYNEFEKLGHWRPRDAGHGPTLPGREGRLAPAQPVEACVWLMRGVGAGRQSRVARNTGYPWVVGRDRACALPLDYDPYISARHAEIRWDGRQFRLLDLKSRNGTSHNWAPLPRGAEAFLRHGDVIGVGESVLLFWDGD